MKKLISCLLVFMMLFSVTGAFAEAAGEGRFGQSNALTEFLKETDLQNQDIALQVQSGDNVADLVIRVDGDNLHLVSRNDAVEQSHLQLNPTGIYVGSEGKVTLLRYATVATVTQNIVKEVDAMLEEAVKSIPEEELPTKAEIKKAKAAIKEALNEMALAAYVAEAQDQADAATLSSAALAFANKFKPEYILDVKEEDGAVSISLRSEAFASALADAMDELMSNPDLAELVDRQAEEEGGKEFAEYQKEWDKYREATLEAIRSIESTGTIEENGHCVGHFQIGEEESAVKILMCDTDAWINAENGDVEITVALGFKNEDPFVVYELAADQYSYREKVTSGKSMAEVKLGFEDDKLNDGSFVAVVEDIEVFKAEFGPDYLNVKGLLGGISTSVRETWTGKTRFELVAETADGQESSVTVDFYEDGDSLVCELYTSESDQSAMFKISRIDKINIEDLSASANINEITVENINAELEGILKLIAKTAK